MSVEVKNRIKINNTLYGVYGEPSNFKAVKYMESVLMPEKEYYKIGDIVDVLSFNYDTGVYTYIVADKNTLISVKDKDHLRMGKGDYIIGLNRYYYIQPDITKRPNYREITNIEGVTLELDYKTAYEELLKEMKNNVQL